eukprot:5042042-Amphidinium_carterae.3
MVNGMMESLRAINSHNHMDTAEWLQWLQWTAIEPWSATSGDQPMVTIPIERQGLWQTVMAQFWQRKKGQLRIANIADYPAEDHNAYSETQDWSCNQDWESWNNYPTTGEEYPQYPEPIQQIMQQPPYNGQPVYSLYDVGSTNNSGREQEDTSWCTFTYQGNQTGRLGDGRRASGELSTTCSWVCGLLNGAESHRNVPLSDRELSAAILDPHTTLAQSFLVGHGAPKEQEYRIRGGRVGQACSRGSLEAADEETAACHQEQAVAGARSLAIFLKSLSLGVTEENINEVEVFVEKSKQLQARCAASCSAKKEELADEGDAVAEIDAFPPKVTYLCDCTVAMFRDRFLPALEPSALSMANCRSHERAIGGKKGFMEIFEYACGLQADYLLKDVFNSAQEFLDMAIERSIARGRRCRDLNLPPFWESDGLFKVVGVCKTSRSVRMQQSFSKEVLAVPIGAASWSFFSDPKYAVVFCNYSEIKAALWSKRDSRHARTVSLAGHFRERKSDEKEGGQTTSPPRKRQKVKGNSPADAESVLDEDLHHTLEASVAGMAGLGASPSCGADKHGSESGLDTPAKVKHLMAELVQPSVDESKIELPSPSKVLRVESLSTTRLVHGPAYSKQKPSCTHCVTRFHFCLTVLALTRSSAVENVLGSLLLEVHSDVCVVGREPSSSRCMLAGSSRWALATAWCREKSTAPSCSRAMVLLEGKYRGSRSTTGESWNSTHNRKTTKRVTVMISLPVSLFPGHKLSTRFGVWSSTAARFRTGFLEAPNCLHKQPPQCEEVRLLERRSQLPLVEVIFRILAFARTKMLSRFARFAGGCRSLQEVVVQSFKHHSVGTSGFATAYLGKQFNSGVSSYAELFKTLLGCSI